MTLSLNMRVSVTVSSNVRNNFFLRLSPIGICSLIAGKLAGMKDINENLESLGLYMLTVIIGLLIHSIITLPIIYFVIVRKNPVRFFLGMGSALLTAFGTSSRSETKLIHYSMFPSFLLSFLETIYTLI